MTADELKTLLRSDQSEESKRAVDYLVTSLTSRDANTRRHGYELLDEALKDALYQSCLNYGLLVGGFTQPLIAVVTRTVEFWATQRDRAAL